MVKETKLPKDLKHLVFQTVWYFLNVIQRPHFWYVFKTNKNKLKAISCSCSSIHGSPELEVNAYRQGGR